MQGEAILTSTVSLLLGAAALTLLFVSRTSRRATTLTAPAMWSALSFVLLALFPVLTASGFWGKFAEPIRFITAVSAFCPMMALLGAKRPQDKAWQWIVGSLWGLLALPALETIAFRPGQTLYIAPAWAWLMIILLAIEASNHLPTRYWPSAILTLSGQVLLVGPYLPGQWFTLADWQMPVGLGCLVVALGLVSFGFPRRSATQQSIDLMWIDFRDRFGAAWGLRILQRLQETARMCKWDVNATWQGFETAAGSKPLSPEATAQVEQALASLLWRFVSKEWMEERKVIADPETENLS